MSDSKKNITTPTTIITIDERFGVPWGKREIQTLDSGASRLFIRFDSMVFRVVETPAPYFGQNVQEFGWNVAIDMAGDASYSDHDFGPCIAQVGSVQLAEDGFWYMKVVPTHPRRVTVYMREEYEDGTAAIVPRHRTESWLLVRLDQITPMTSHPLAAPFRQRDTLTEKAHRAAQASEDALKVNTGKRGGNRTKRRRLSNAELAKLLNG